MSKNNPEKKLQDFLIKSRKDANLSQAEVAARSAIFGMGPVLDQRAVSRFEQQPLSADPIKVAGYMSAIGLPTKRYYDLLEMSFQPEKKFDISRYIAEDVSKQIEDTTGQIDDIINKLKECDCPYINDFGVFAELQNAKLTLANLNRRPIIGFFGHFDAGKSTLINTIIDQDILPAQYTPATCTVNLLMHIDDRPEYLHGDVALFRRGFSPHMMRESGPSGEFLLEEGDISILDRLGVHNYDESIGKDAYIAAIFLDIELLRHIWLLDTPGDLNNSDDGFIDAEIALGGAELADGIVYLSSTTGFLNGDDEGLFAEILRNHPPLTPEAPTEHLIFVQTHCHSEVPPEQIEKVKAVTFKRLQKKMEHLIFEHWKNDGAIDVSPTPDQLAKHIQAFWRENEELRQGTLKSIQGLVQYLVEHNKTITQKNIQRLISQLKNSFSNVISSLEARKMSTEERIHEVYKQDARFCKEVERLLDEFSKLFDSCDVYCSEDKEAMSLIFNNMSKPDDIEDIIRSLYDDKKDAQSGISNYISQTLTGKLESTLKRSGHRVSDRLDSILVRWTSAMPSLRTKKFKNDFCFVDVEKQSSFDARSAFIGGLAGIGSLGAMALYVSTIASNLGAYILVGKAAGVLVSLGIIGSVTTATSFVAAIGGPITIGLALAALLSLAIYRLLGGSWQKSLAKKVSKALLESNAIEDIHTTVDKFWDNTKRALAAGLRELRSQTDAHLNLLKEDAKRNYDPKDLQESIHVLKSVQDMIKIEED